MSTSRQNSQKNNFLSYLIDSAKFGVIGIVITIIIMLVTSLAITDIMKHERFYSLIAIICQCVPSFISSKMIGRKFSHSLLFIGILQGICILLIYFLISLIFLGVDIDYSNLIKSLPYVILSGVLGSITSGAKQKKHRHS